MKAKLVLAMIAGLFLQCAYANTIKFATEATYAPFEYIENGEIKGFDIAIAKALCQEMKTECSFSNQEFNSLIPSLKLGKFDAIIASLGITPEREKQVAFTQSYYQPSASYVAATVRHYTLNQLEGKTIGTQAGTTFAQYLQKKYEGKITLKTYASMQEAFLDLTAGRIDMVLADMPIANAWLKTHYQEYSVIEKPITNAEYFGTGYGIAVNPKNTALLNELNKALTTIKANGQYQKIVKEYLGA